MSDPLQDIIQELVTCIDRTKTHQSTGSYQLVLMKLSELQGALREMHQAMTETQMREIIRKLGKHAPVTDEEIALIREWIVGDAESYTTNEKNLNIWLSLFDRLTKDLQEIYNPDISPSRVLQLTGLTQIAIRLIPNIIYYISERERVEAFERAVSDGLDAFESTAYHDILSAKLESTNQ